MKKMRLEISASVAIGFVIIILGIVQIIIGANSNDIAVIIRGCAYMALGSASSASGIERLLNFKLDKIHEWFGPYDTKKQTLFDIRGNILKFLGICAYTGGTILLLLSTLGRLPVENSGLSIGLIALGLAFSSLGRMHTDNRKYDDIAEGINSMDKDLAAIKDESVKITKKLEILDKNIEEKSREHSGTDNISDVEI